MKHILWIACLFLLGTYPLQAQSQASSYPSASSVDSVYARQVSIDQQPRDWYYGLRLGGVLSNFGGDADSTNNKVGLLLGAFIGKDCSTQLSFVAGIQYLKLGSAIDSDSARVGITDAPRGSTLSASAAYIAIPVQARYFPFERNGFFVDAGLQAGILLDAELIGLGGDYEASGGYVNVKDELTSVDIAPMIGVGYEWRKGLEFSIVYQHGISNALSNDNYKISNRGWQLALGYRF